MRACVRAFTYNSGLCKRQCNNHPHKFFRSGSTMTSFWIKKRKKEKRRRENRLIYVSMYLCIIYKSLFVLWSTPTVSLSVQWAIPTTVSRHASVLNHWLTLSYKWKWWLIAFHGNNDRKEKRSQHLVRRASSCGPEIDPRSRTRAGLLMSSSLVVSDPDVTNQPISRE